MIHYNLNENFKNRMFLSGLNFVGIDFFKSIFYFYGYRLLSSAWVGDVQAPPLQARTFQALQESFRPVA
jgi:hypothetical protein